MELNRTADALMKSEIVEVTSYEDLLTSAFVVCRNKAFSETRALHALSATLSVYTYFDKNTSE